MTEGHLPGLRLLGNCYEIFFVFRNGETYWLSFTSSGKQKVFSWMESFSYRPIGNSANLKGRKLIRYKVARYQKGLLNFRLENV